MSIHKALSELAPNANWCMDGAQTYGNLQWNSNDITKPTELEVNNKIAEIEAAFPLKYLREERNAMLAESDWTQTPDVPEAIKTAWQTYRQELRDLPSKYPNPTFNGDANVASKHLRLTDVVWPTKPS
tara:strand:+ start:455 stop:838 length:384 start_codon:yes stop_codon:yes gene_type:complete